MHDLKITRTGDAPGAVSITVDGVELKGVTAYHIAHSVDDACPTVTLSLALNSVEYENAVKLLIDHGERPFEVQIEARGTAAVTHALDRLAASVAHAYPGATIVDGAALVDKYLAIPRDRRWAIICDLGIITRDEMTEALVDMRTAGARIDKDVFSRALKGGKLVEFASRIDAALDAIAQQQHTTSRESIDVDTGEHPVFVPLLPLSHAQTSSLP